MGVLSWQCLVIPKFSALPSGETMRQTPKCFGDARTCSRSSVTMPSLVGLGFHPPLRWPKTLSILFVCLFVGLFVTLLNVRDCAPDFAANFALIGQTVAKIWRFCDFSWGGRSHLWFWKFWIFKDRKGHEGQNVSPRQISRRSLERLVRYDDFSIF